MRISWLDNTRKEILFEISQLVQGTKSCFKEDAAVYLKSLNDLVLYGYNNVAYLAFPKLDLNSIHILGYTDPAFANK